VTAALRTLSRDALPAHGEGNVTAGAPAGFA
jgi:hypothetical protein